MEDLPTTYQGDEAERRARLHPKVRMVLDGDNEVNLVRSEISASVQVDYDKAFDQELVIDMSAGDLEQRDLSKTVPVKVDIADSAPSVSEEMPRSAAPPPDALGDAAPPLDPYANIPDPKISVFVQLVAPNREDGTSSTTHTKLPGETSRVGDLVMADVNRDDLARLSGYSFVARVEPGEPVKHPRPRLGLSHRSESNRPSFLRDPRTGGIDHKDGEDVLVGIIDVEGFDFAHEDFLDAAGKTRFVSIWDQGGQVREPPLGYGFGSEFRAEHLNGALAQSTFTPTAFEPQSVMKKGSHGTHVASIAAGNSGICSKAEIAGVLVALDDRDHDRRRSLYDSTRIAHGVSYLMGLAQSRGKRLVVNISLGTNGHAHDASSPTSRWIDALLVQPGRAVCVAAGNAGQMDQESEADFGHVLGRVHTRGKIPAAGLRRELEWQVVGNGIEDISENEMEIWYPSQDRFCVQVKPPGRPWSPVVEPRQYLENHELSDRTRLSIYNELYHTANGANHISIFLSPFLDPAGVKGVAHGTWKVRLIGHEVRNGTFDCWIERDDPRPMQPGVHGGLWRFPSFFGERTFSRRATVSSLACGQRVVSVANHDVLSERINSTSSLGPTRDGRDKPDIAAPGTDIVAARGFAPDDEEKWVTMTGTSMASPYVAGVTGLMLAVEPQLTAAQVVGIIRRTAQPLPGSDFEWQRDAGFGILDPAAAIQEAHSFSTYTDIDKASEGDS